MPDLYDLISYHVLTCRADYNHHFNSLDGTSLHRCVVRSDVCGQLLVTLCIKPEESEKAKKAYM
ncbi:hypothetical protein SCLCIDRAFT_1216317 [Scleroderma citrinum Foug A]|uniref:Uncharacterized protein n=1 Tax=Scleroderma citrinum Foug A TaxID=1036808 RepID=A0A0C3DYQ6_9AGAM|nr:hypothetical protein SCLCIDRAFT_1216317 [Scleroderma citrinum Foug A]